MMVRKLVMLTALAATTVAAMPASAFADGRDHDRRRYSRYREPPPRAYYVDRRDCRTSGTTGLIVGGGAGALLGRELDREGSRTTGTVLGAAAGALLGREIDRKSKC
jgi:uncharacterized protein YcfJ